jgi:glyoxylase-like metal-dependent hydrolase (beta-lactamase superfamily II)
MTQANFQADYFAGQTAPAPGQAQAIDAGVYWLRMPLPLVLDHINLWLLEDGAGWTVVDCGLTTDATRAAWEQLFAGVLGGRAVTRVICTHMHPDHLGLADWLCKRFDAPLCMTQGEYLSGRIVSAGLLPTDTGGELELFQRHGAPESLLHSLRGRGNFYATMVPAVPLHYRRLVDRQRLSIGGLDWEVVVGGGHSPEHASLWCAERGLLISGDMLLPRISTNVSVYPIEWEADPLGVYLDALGRFEALPQATRVLPSHGLPFRGAAARVRDLREHHAERLASVLEACATQACSAADLLPRLFRRALDAHQMRFAMGEAIAHVHRLWACGALRREPGAGGVYRFRGTDAAADHGRSARAAAGL